MMSCYYFFSFAVPLVSEDVKIIGLWLGEKEEWMVEGTWLDDSAGGKTVASGVVFSISRFSSESNFFL